MATKATQRDAKSHNTVQQIFLLTTLDHCSTLYKTKAPSLVWVLDLKEPKSALLLGVSRLDLPS